MGGGETGVGESPAGSPTFHGIGPGGLPMKKKVWPKAAPKKLKQNKEWQKSFNKYGTKFRGKP